jgi:hypothetical protein
MRILLINAVLSLLHVCVAQLQLRFIFHCDDHPITMDTLRGEGKQLIAARAVWPLNRKVIRKGGVKFALFLLN